MKYIFQLKNISLISNTTFKLHTLESLLLFSKKSPFVFGVSMTLHSFHRQPFNSILKYRFALVKQESFTVFEISRSDGGNT